MAINKDFDNGDFESLNLTDLIDMSRVLSHKNFGRGINFYYTSVYFPAVSITGSSCALNCKHCRGILIKRLIDTKTPKELIRACMEFHKEGSRGVLITGGCTNEGKVPLNNFLDAIREIKDKTDLILFAHTGIVNYEDAKGLKYSGIDGVCVDIVGSEDTTREIYGIELYPEDYIKTLRAFERAGMGNISPHICVGLHYGKPRHELNALDIISYIKPSNVVIIGLTNLDGTPMRDIRINPEDLIRILCLARFKFKDSYVSLGCARGKGYIREEIDKLAIRAGVNNIAIPTSSAYKEANKLNLKIREFGACCAVLPSQLQLE